MGVGRGNGHSGGSYKQVRSISSNSSHAAATTSMNIVTADRFTRISADPSSRSTLPARRRSYKETS